MNQVSYTSLRRGRSLFTALLRRFGHRQQPERQYEVLTVDEWRLLAARLAEAVLRFRALEEVVVPF